MNPIRNRAMEDEGELYCPHCGSNNRVLLEVNDEDRLSHWKCRRCDTLYWENLATGMVLAGSAGTDIPRRVQA